MERLEAGSNSHPWRSPIGFISVLRVEDLDALYLRYRTGLRHERNHAVGE
jgi:hypothetical protein